MLVQLLYFSTASHPMSQQDFETILAKAREKNERLNVTGMLLYYDGTFKQVLEGEQSIVRQLFEIIKNDKRHKAVNLVIEKPINQRSFPSWSMAFRKLQEGESTDIENYFEIIE